MESQRRAPDESSPAISWPVTLHMVSLHGDDMSSHDKLSAILHYGRHDPCAVTLVFTDDDTSWSFSRDLLAGGLRKPTGMGDVSCWRMKDDLMIRLSSPEGRMLLAARLVSIRLFLQATYRIVPFGREARELDMSDSALTEWIDG